MPASKSAFQASPSVAMAWSLSRGSMAGQPLDTIVNRAFSSLPHSMVVSHFFSPFAFQTLRRATTRPGQDPARGRAATILDSLLLSTKHFD